MRMLVVSGLFVALCGSAQAEQDAVQSTILQQIEAFRADDFATAFGFASTAIRDQFGTAEIFGSMVQKGYPMVYRPADVTMVDQRRLGDFVLQRVMITDQQGRGHLLDYQLIETPEGWRINGVWPVPEGGPGV